MIWGDFTQREKWLAGALAFLVTIWIGWVVGLLIAFPPIAWDALTALATIGAVCVATLGYLDVRKANRRASQAFLDIDIDYVWLKDREICVECTIYNRGQTNAYKAFPACSFVIAGPVQNPENPWSHSGKSTELPIVAPQGVEQLRFVFTMKAARIASLRNGRRYLHVFVGVPVYTDIHGDKQGQAPKHRAYSGEEVAMLESPQGAVMPRVQMKRATIQV